MTMKGKIKNDHAPKNNWEMKVLGMPDLTITTQGNIEEELKTVELPDNTVASGGDTKPGEFQFSVPMHHKIEQVALELWYLEGQGPVSPTYKKPAVMTYKTIGDKIAAMYALEGCFLKKRGLPGTEMGDNGEMLVSEWTCSFDKASPIR
jgi:hypothetical protein